MTQAEPLFPADLRLDSRLKWIFREGQGEVLNLGAGTNPFQGATNHNIAPGPAYQVNFDLTQFPWPLEDAKYLLVTAFHVLEHIPIHFALQFMQECLRVTVPDGALILEVPDIIGMSKALLDGNMGIVGRMYGKYTFNGEGHVWGWDRSQLMLISRLAGWQTCITKEGTDYHSVQIPTIRLEAVKH